MIRHGMWVDDIAGMISAVLCMSRVALAVDISIVCPAKPAKLLTAAGASHMVAAVVLLNWCLTSRTSFAVVGNELLRGGLLIRLGSYALSVSVIRISDVK